jgi:hypothetical protein
MGGVIASMSLYQSIFFSVLFLTVPLLPQQWTFITGTPVVYSTPYYNAFGLMVKANNGNILNFYREGREHAGDRGVMMLRTSNDSGRTWSYFSGINYCQASDRAGCLFSDPTYDSRNGAGGITSTGTIILFWEKYQSTGAGSPAKWVYYCRSTDNGLTWSTPAELTSTNPVVRRGGTGNPQSMFDGTYGQLLVVPSRGGAKASCSTGCVAVSVQDNSGYQWLVFSYDDGVTWTDAKKIGNATWPKLRTDEVALLWIGGSQIIGFVRGEATFKGTLLFFLYSPDMGTTWPTIGNTNFPTTPAGGTIIAIDYVSPWLINPNLPDGSVTLIFPERQIVNGVGAFGYLRAITFRPQDAINNPMGFGPTQTIYTEPKTNSWVDFGYPSMVQISARNLLIEFYAPALTLGPKNLFTMTAQYECSAGVAHDCSFGEPHFRRGKSRGPADIHHNRDRDR